MAKDPAFLFYPNDFDAATKFFSHEQVGSYLRLLIAQFQHGRLSEKQVMFICRTHDDEIMAKFKRDESGLFYNERLEFEINKRKAFSESRKNNRIGKIKTKEKTSKTHEKHMCIHMENENENENRKLKIELPFNTHEFLLTWGEWKAYKLAQHKFKYKSDKTEKASLSQLVTLSDNNEAVAIKIIEQSIANGWKGFFKLQNIQNGTNQTTNGWGKYDGVSQLLAKTKSDFQTHQRGKANL